MSRKCSAHKRDQCPYKGDHRESNGLCLPPSEDARRRQAAAREPGSCPSPHIIPMAVLILGLPGFQNSEKSMTKGRLSQREMQGSKKNQGLLLYQTNMNNDK